MHKKTFCKKHKRNLLWKIERKSKTKQNKTNQNKTNQNKTKHLRKNPNHLQKQNKTLCNKTKQDHNTLQQNKTKVAKQNKTKQNNTRQDKTRQDKTRQDKTRQDKTRQDKTQHNTTKQNTTKQQNTKNRTKQNKTKQNTCPTMRFDVYSCGIALIAPGVCSRICGTGTEMFRCTRRTCQNNATQVLSLQRKKGEVRIAVAKWKIDQRVQRKETRNHLRRDPLASSTSLVKRNTRTRRKNWCETRGRNDRKNHLWQAPATPDEHFVSATSPSSRNQASSWQESLATRKGRGRLSCEIWKVHKASLFRPCSSSVRSSSTASICLAMRTDGTRVPPREDNGMRLSCEIYTVHKASLSWPWSSYAPSTPTTGCRNSSGASGTSSPRRGRPSCSPPRAASAPR